MKNSTTGNQLPLPPPPAKRCLPKFSIRHRRLLIFWTKITYIHQDHYFNQTWIFFDIFYIQRLYFFNRKQTHFHSITFLSKSINKKEDGHMDGRKPSSILRDQPYHVQQAQSTSKGLSWWCLGVCFLLLFGARLYWNFFAFQLKKS